MKSFGALSCSLEFFGVGGPSLKIRSLVLYMGFSSPPRTKKAPKHEKKLPDGLQTLGIDAAREYSKS